MIASLPTRVILGVLLLVPAVVPGIASAAPVDPKLKFTLSQFIPQDCWMVIQAADNPERAFIDEHWSRVFNALKGTGIGEDIKTLVFSGAPPEQRAQVEEGFTTAMKLLAGVRWGDLVGREMVFAERLTHFIPEIIVLCRSSPGSVEGNVAGLKAIMNQIATFSESLSITESDMDGAKVWRLAAPNVPFAFFLLHRDDVVGLMLGEKAVQEIAALLAGKEAARSFAQNARFKKAVADLPPAENELGYFDIKMLMGNLGGIFEMAFKKSGGKPTTAPADSDDKSAESLAPRIVARVVDHFNFIDYMVFSTHTDGLQEFSTTDIRLQPSCTQKSLCKMFTEQKPFERFDKYVPKSATGFSLWNGVDLKELYDTVLEFIKDEVPDGAEALAKWAKFQEEMGFDVEADFFSWWSGEMISVTLAPAVKTPFSSSDSVLMVRVKDAKLASAKINAGLERLNTLLKEHNQALIIRDETEVHAEGFRSVTHPMLAMVGKAVIGVADGHLIIASSAEGINQCLDTAAGKGPSIAENARFKAEGITPKGPVSSASFTDLSNMGQELAAMFFSLGFASAFIPDEEETKPIKAIFGMLSKLSPAINEINFFSSASSVTTFDGQGWRSRQIVTYKSMPAETTTQEVATKP